MTTSDEPDFGILETKLLISFTNKDLLSQAMTRQSYLKENPRQHLESNERLEFLGDAVVQLTVSECLYKNSKRAPGELTNRRKDLVDNETIARAGYVLHLDRFLRRSKGESQLTGSDAILANAYEALVGAVFLDKGYEETARFVNRTLPILQTI